MPDTNTVSKDDEYAELQTGNDARTPFSNACTPWVEAVLVNEMSSFGV